MGADDKSILTKCGEILINLKVKNKKSKIYQFNCGYCNINCDKFKKFSKHIENKHFKELTEESGEKSESCLDINEESEDKPLIYEPHVKLEELVEKKSNNVLISKINDDPLGTRSSTAMFPKNEDANDSIMKNIKIENYREKCEDYYDGNIEMYNEDDDDNDNDENIDSDSEDRTEIETANNSKNVGSSKELKRRRSKRKTQDDYAKSDNSNDSDYDFEQEMNQKAQLKSKKKKQIDTEKECIISESDIIIDENQLSIALLESFEKQPKLWDVKTRTSDKVLMQTYYEIISNEANEKFKYNLKWQDVKRRIIRMRSDYTTELEKQRKGEEYDIPWYAEHMKYLQENIEVVLKGRYEVSKYRALKTMDHAELSSLIELYKKREILWQVNNLAYGIGKKKDELFEEIREEFNQIHNLNITAENLHRRVNYMHRLYSKDKKLALKCELENSDFVPTSSFYQEMSFLSDSQGPFKCSTCNEVIDKFERYHIHVAKHNNVLPFICPQCQMGFNKFGKYLIHTRRHLGIHNFFCDICGKGYPFKAELEYHVTSHTGNKPFLCQICGEGFRARHEHETHVRKHDNRFRYECEICKQGFYIMHLYQAHVKSHLNIRDFVCNICGKDYITKKNLRRHELTHKDLNNFECEICNKKFAQKSTLLAHQKIHLEAYAS